jgi:hypothetical protein
MSNDHFRGAAQMVHNELIARDKALDNINAVLKAHQIRPRGKSTNSTVATWGKQ